MWKWSDLKRLLGFQKAEPRELAAVMWPVVYPVVPERPEWRPSEPHCTIIYFGEVKDLNFTKDEVIECIRETYHSVYLWARVTGLDWFGLEKNVPVLTVEHDYLQTYHDSLVACLAARGIKWDETFAYKPHVSITNEAALDNQYPSTLLLTPVELWWGGEHIRIDNDEQITGVGQ